MVEALNPEIPSLKTAGDGPLVNACKLCAPLGASLAFKGVEGGMALLHGSQGCATYIRRYMISHFREPIDIASSNFSESAAVFGGDSNLMEALKNVEQQYHPSIIGVATTCLAETLGDDVPGMLLRRDLSDPEAAPALFVSTPSFKGTHAEGYVAACRALAEHFAEEGVPQDTVNVMPGMASPEDLRWIKSLFYQFGLNPILLPDYSETLDGGAWQEYKALSPGGTSIESLRGMARSWASLELGATLGQRATAGSFLEEKFGVAREVMPLPVGLKATDRLLRFLAELSNKRIPGCLHEARGRLLDAYADGHKALFGLKVAVYGEEDMAVALAAWLAETGCQIRVVASGGESQGMQQALNAQIPGFERLDTKVMQGVDFDQIGQACEEAGIDLLVGNSKGYSIAKAMGIPLLRSGFPVHDRFGGARILHLGYDGALRLYDQMVNLVLERKQKNSEVGYGYF
jgi:nitrogenase molybdenum-iron protein NifN